MPSSLFFFQKRRERLYSIEVRRIIRENFSDNFLVSKIFIFRIILSKKGEALKIYVDFAHSKDEKDLLKYLNVFCSKIIQKEMAKSRKFCYIPKVIFLLDKEAKEEEEIRGIIKKLL
jgi:ribosome-binding factor A